MLDTNIIVSAVLFPESALSQRVLEMSDRYSLVISDKVVAELREVMIRKFEDKTQACETFLRKLDFELALTPADTDPDIYPKIRDENDYPILASAIIADVDVFVSGDRDFFAADVERPEIMTIVEFSEVYLQ
jgi:predicted nucleic acid-binding protein